MRRWRRPTQDSAGTVCEASAWLSQLMDEDRQRRVAPDELLTRATRLHEQVRELATTERNQS